MRIKVDALFFIMLASVMLSDSGTALFAFIAAALHEGAHLAVMRIFSLVPESMTVSCCGLMMKVDDTRCTHWQRMLISVSGAAANLTVAAFFYKIPPVAAANVLLGALSLLPVRPLDGGELIYIMFEKYLSYEFAQKITFIISAVVLLPLTGIGFYILLGTKYNYSLLSLCLCIFASVYERFLFDR